MVFENTIEFPTPEDAVRRCPPPSSTYGFQKLAVEYFAQGAHEQYGLPFTIARPFNCVGIGERRALTDKEVLSGNVKLAMSHVVPDLVQKILKRQDPLHLLGSGNQVRHYTYGGDLAKGIAACVFHERAANEAFNLSTPVGTTVLELAELIWRKVHGSGPGAKPFRYVSDEPYPYGVPRRVAGRGQGRREIGFTATTGLDEVPREVIPWIRAAGRGPDLNAIPMSNLQTKTLAAETASAQVSRADRIDGTAALRYSVVVPVFNEADNIGAFCRAARSQLPAGYEVLVCYDFDTDTTLPALAALDETEKPANLRLVRNDLGPGVRYAIEAGMREARAPDTYC